MSTKTWNNITPSFAGAWNIDGDRNAVVKYVSPTFVGFTASATWGEDDFWDAALRYAGEFNGIRIAAGIGYKQQNGNPGKSGSDGDICADIGLATESGVDCHNISGSASVMHVPTGLFVSGSYAQYSDNNRKALFGANVKDKDTYWQILGGIEQNWFGFGKTTLYGEYAHHDTGAGLSSTGGINAFAAVDIQGGAGRLASSEVTLWGLGINQEISAAAMDIYVSYRNFSPDVKTSVSGIESGSAKANVQDFQAVMMGAIIRF